MGAYTGTGQRRGGRVRTGTLRRRKSCSRSVFFPFSLPFLPFVLSFHSGGSRSELVLTHFFPPFLPPSTPIVVPAPFCFSRFALSSSSPPTGLQSPRRQRRRRQRHSRGPNEVPRTSLPSLFLRRRFLPSDLFPPLPRLAGRRRRTLNPRQRPRHRPPRAHET